MLFKAVPSGSHCSAELCAEPAGIFIPRPGLSDISLRETDPPPGLFRASPTEVAPTVRGGPGLQMACKEKGERVMRPFPLPPLGPAPHPGLRRTLGTTCKGTGAEVLACHPCLSNYRELSTDAHGL